MHGKRIALIVLAALAFSGCARYSWQHPYKDKAALAQDKQECTRQAVASYPVLMETYQTSAGYTTPSTTNCYPVGRSVQCYTTPGQYYPPTYGKRDVNQAARHQAVDACLVADGWTYTQEQDTK